MPVAVEREAEDDETDAAEDSGWIDDDETRFGVQTALVASCVEGADCVVEVVPDEPADDDADDAEEVEVSCRMLAGIS